MNDLIFPADLNAPSLETLSVSSDHVLDGVSDEKSFLEPSWAALDPSMFDDGLAIVVQPPREIRSSSKGEKRIVSVSVLVPYSDSVRTLRCRLERALDGKHVRGGLRGDVKNTLQPGAPVSGVLNLSLCVCSTSRKHGDEDLVIAVALESEGRLLSRVRTSPFYAYSHQSTLKRRKQIAVSSVGPLSGRTVAVSGFSFLDSPKLNVLFQVGDETYETDRIRYMNDRLLEANVPQSLKLDSSLQVVVTNDGRYFSEPVAYASTSQAAPDTVKRARL